MNDDFDGALRLCSEATLINEAMRDKDPRPAYYASIDYEKRELVVRHIITDEEVCRVTDADLFIGLLRQC